MTGKHTFDVKCPQCGKNEWKLTYSGEYEKDFCDTTETLACYLYIHGTITIQCECGYTHKVDIGSE